MKISMKIPQGGVENFIYLQIISNIYFMLNLIGKNIRMVNYFFLHLLY